MTCLNSAVYGVVESLERRWLLAAGDLDPTFGTGGRYIDPHELVPTDVAVQGDGKILISGYGLHDVGSLLRLNANGTPDTSFGSNGYAISGFGLYASYASAVATGPGGKIAVSGFAGPFRNELPNQATLVVYDSSGKLDKSFDGDGIVNAPQFSRGFTDVAFQSDGKILALGEKLVRYNANGTLDTSFDGDGIADVSGKKVAIDANGKIVVLGYFAVFRFNANGTRDTSFDGDGVLPNVKGTDLVIAPDGGILVAGNGPHQTFVTRFNAAGSVDEGFGSHGNALTYGSVLAATADHVYTGFQIDSLDLSHDEMVISALGADGQYDESFDLNGTTRTSFGAGDVRAVGLAIQDGKLLALASVEETVGPGATVLKPALARYDLGAAAPTQTPFGGTPIAIPGGDIRAADFDKGGEGVAYHDTGAGNLGGFNYRPGEGVDVQNKAAGGPYVGFVKAGEWLEYTINVAASGLYDVLVGTAHQGTGGQFHLELDGNRLTNQLTAWHGRDWQDFAGVGQSGVFLPAGRHVLRIAMDSNGSYGYVGNFLNVFIRDHVGYAGSPFLGRPFQPGERIEAEDYDVGGEGVAYHDTGAGNVGGAYRPLEGPDVQPTTDAGGGYNVGFVTPGEWLGYSVSAPETASYNFQFRVASLKPGGSFRILIDGNARPVQFIGDTGGWQTYVTLAQNAVPLTAGQHVIRIEMETAGALGYVGNFNWWSFAKA